MVYRSNNAIGGLGASSRPGDIRRSQHIVQRGLEQLVDDTEAHQDTLREAYFAMTNDERTTPEGTRIGEALDKAIALLGVLKGARLLCPVPPSTSLGGDFKDM
ncbi:MAG: hypothetical protein ACRYFS_01445 [Janthinobacterium lividum]